MVIAEDVSRIGVVVGEVMGVGFKMAGIEHVYSEASMVNVLMEEDEIKLIVITSDIFKRLDEEVKQRVLNSADPAVVILDSDEEKMKEYAKKITGAEL